MSEDIIPDLIKFVVFNHVGILWMIQPKEQIEFDVDEVFAHWCKYEPCYNEKKCYNLHGPVFEYFFVTERKDIYELMCG